MASKHPDTKNPTPEVCGALGCRRTDRVELVEDGRGRVRALCPQCAKEFLGVTT